MSLSFRPAVRENVGLFVGLAGGTGSGKTMSAMKMAKGIVGPGGRFAVIDTENRRALHYAEMFDFDVLELDAPFSSDRYEEAMLAASKAGYKAIVVDSGSHEHDGHGGYLDTQAEELEQLVERLRVKAEKNNWKFNEWDAIDKMTPLSWNKPKKRRKRMMHTALACSTAIPIIWCFRAEEKVFTTKDGKLVANNPPVWAPTCGKGMPFEMTVFFMLHQQNPGVPVPIKLQDQHKPLFPLNKPLDETTGRAIATWAAGVQPKSPSPAPSTAPGLLPDGAQKTQDEGDLYIAPEQVVQLEAKCQECGVPTARLMAAAKVSALGQITKPRYQEALKWLDRRAAEARESNRAG